MIRKPAVSGQFYPGTASALEKQISLYVDQKAEKKNAIGAVCPHAGYIYSGPVAGATISKIAPADSFVILGPNHTGIGPEFSIMTGGTWKTPLGDAEIDSELASQLLTNSSLLKDDASAHAFEHSIEVQIPFLQYLFKTFVFVPIVVSHAGASTYKNIGSAIAKAIKSSKKKIVIIASSDMTHYETHESAKQKDAKAIDAILALDVDKLLQTVEKSNISMCGYGPVAIMLAAAKELGAKGAELVKYQTSGDASGDYSAVVGYAGIIVS